MSDQDSSPESSNSLLRRLLDEQHETRLPEDSDLLQTVDASGPSLPSKTELPQAPVSPIRPTMPEPSSRSLEPLPPSMPDKSSTEVVLTPREQMQRAEEALIYLREKMAQVAAEFDQGRLNQAQFDAIYSRYSEQRDITERLLARNPETQAWQSVIQPGHTQFLRKQFEARVISYAIYDQLTAAAITVSGPIQIRQAQVNAVLARLRAVIQQRGTNPGPAQKKLPDGRYVLIVPGELTTALVIFSLEPAAVQKARVQDIHRDFERANQQALRRQDFTAGRLVFPHRALFEDKKP